MQVQYVSNPVVEAGAKLTSILRTSTHSNILLLVSGGSAFSILDYVDESVLGNHITLCVLDERYSTDPAVNNFAQLQQTEFFMRCAHARVDFISTKVGKGESPEDVAVFWESSLRMWKAENPDGLIVATMGIGPDGHTAGIFPGEHGVEFDGDSWIVSYSVPPAINPYTDRITVTNTFLREQVDEFVGYAVGKEKQAYIDMLVSGDCLPSAIPACVMCSMKSGTLYTDVE